MTLDDLKWEYRIVLYFPEEDESSLVINDSIQQEIQERKIAYFIFGDSVVSNIEASFSPTYLQQIEYKYRMGYKGSVYALLGLDGGMKLKKEVPLEWGPIFQAVDAMPIRQSEKRRGAI